ncbi:MAG TPA: TetR/AcrR family transcriptional regulator [Azospirillaceae bacterium]|nr:TetR/AcrR family transcriptional regulator [Azospirillaceae bacterium]
MVDTPTKPRRRRLTPEARQNQILNDAARLIIEEGLTAVSMERLGREAGISKALVYNYFPSRDDLLAALLNREFEELRARGLEQILRVDNFDDLIRFTTRLYLQHIKAHGALLQALFSDPSVVRLIQESNRVEQEQTIRYFVKQVRKEFRLPLDIAIATTHLLMAVTDRAGKLVSEENFDLDLAEDLCVRLLTAGLRALSQVYAEPDAEGGRPAVA